MSRAYGDADASTETHDEAPNVVRLGEGIDHRLAVSGCHQRIANPRKYGCELIATIACHYAH
ncbi:hypothetical protein MBRA_03719 [Methylobacterium brachiatum]|nr:hypothetical protein MBRA_03719 [Methylobacterium brachiatum]